MKHDFHGWNTFPNNLISLYIIHIWNDWIKIQISIQLAHSCHQATCFTFKNSYDRFHITKLKSSSYKHENCLCNKTTQLEIMFSGLFLWLGRHQQPKGSEGDNHNVEANINPNSPTISFWFRLNKVIIRLL